MIKPQILYDEDTLLQNKNIFPLISSQRDMMQNSNTVEEMRIFSLFYYCTSELAASK